MPRCIDGGTSAPKSHVGTWQKRLRSFFILPGSFHIHFMKLRDLPEFNDCHGDITTAPSAFDDMIRYVWQQVYNKYTHIRHIRHMSVHLHPISAIPSLPSLCPSFQCCRESGISPRCLKRNLIREYREMQKVCPKHPQAPQKRHLDPKFWR